MANPFIDIFSGALGEANTQRTNNQQLMQALQTLIFQKNLEQSLAQQQQEIMMRRIKENPEMFGMGSIQPSLPPALSMPTQKPQIPFQQAIAGMPENQRPAMSLASGGMGTIHGQPVDLKQVLQRMLPPQPRQPAPAMLSTQPIEQQQQPFRILLNPSTGMPERIANPAYESPVREAREERLSKEQGLRDLKNDFNALISTGGVLDRDQMNRFTENLGYNISPDDEIASGRVSKIMLPGGKTGYRVLPDKVYSRLIEEGKFTPEEQKHIRTIAEEHNAWTRVIDRFNDIGVSPSGPIGEVRFEKTNNLFLRELGVVSIPARFELARQFAGDPKYQALAREVEIAFQKFRTRVTGAQASDKEIARLRQVIAKLTDQPGVFFETIDAFQKDSLDDFRTLLDIKETFGRDTSQFRGLINQGNVFRGPVNQPLNQQGGQSSGQAGQPYSSGKISTGLGYTIER